MIYDRITCEKIEDALSLAPPQEYSLFHVRDQYDLVVLTDADSETFGSSLSPMSTAVRVIYETGFHKPLKRTPVILVGGLNAWKKAYPNEIIQEMGTSLDAQMDRMKGRKPEKRVLGKGR